MRRRAIVQWYNKQLFWAVAVALWMEQSLPTRSPGPRFEPGHQQHFFEHTPCTLLATKLENKRKKGPEMAHFKK